MKSKRVSRKKLAFVFAALAAGAACSSTNKDSNEKLRRVDGLRPRLDLANYIYNSVDPEPRGLAPEELKIDESYLSEEERLAAKDPEKAKSLRRVWQNFKKHPRNYKFSVAVAPLYNEIRREGEDELGAGDAPDRISDTLLGRPINDDESRETAALPAEDRLAGVPRVTEAERNAANTVPSAEPSKEAPASAPTEPSKTEPSKTEPAKSETPEPAKSEPEKSEPAKSETPEPAKAEPAKTETPEPAKAEPVKTEPAKTEPTPEPAKTAPSEEPRPKPRRVGEAPAAAIPPKYYAATDTTAQASTPGSEVAVISTESAAAERIRRLKRVASLEGMNFGIDPTGFRDRMAQVLEEFRVFERVDKLFSKDATLESLFQQADDNKDDFLLVCRLKRNKVSYVGVDPAGWFSDNALWFLFIVPFEFYSWIPREQYECDVELQVTLYDVRSRYKILDQPFEGRDLLVLTNGQRGYQILGNVLISWTSWYGHERLFSNAGEWVRPGAWVDMERQLLDVLQNQMKKRELDKDTYPTFEDNVNPNEVEVEGKRIPFQRKEFGLVVGISKYDEKKAAPKLAQWAVEAMRSGDVQLTPEEARQQLVAAYNDNSVELGTRPYAENDAKAIVDLLHRRGALESRDGVPPANLQILLGKSADVTALRGAFRQIARSRREDRVFVYLNGETLVLDDAASSDGTTKYFLPYDVDLEKVDSLRNDPKALKSYLDENALSFDWIEDCLNRSGSSDHVYVQSRHAMFVVDCSFPGAFTGTRFCPERAKAAQLRLLPGAQFTPGSYTPALDPGKGEKGEKKPQDGKAPEKAPEPEKKPVEKAPEKPVDKAPEPKAPPIDKAPEPKAPEPETPKAPEKAPAPEAPKAIEKAPEGEARPKPRRVGAVFPAPLREQKVTTVLAQSGGDAAPVASEATVATQLVTTNFLERLVQGAQGRVVILTTGPEEMSLDIPDARLGGFVYYFTQFLDPAKQARFSSLRRQDGAFEAKPLLGYTTDRVEAESRQTGRPQHVVTFGDKDRPFVIVSGAR